MPWMEGGQEVWEDEASPSAEVTAGVRISVSRPDPDDVQGPALSSQVVRALGPRSLWSGWRRGMGKQTPVHALSPRGLFPWCICTQTCP